MNETLTKERELSRKVQTELESMRQAMGNSNSISGTHSSDTVSINQTSSSIPQEQSSIIENNVGTHSNHRETQSPKHSKQGANIDTHSKSSPSGVGISQSGALKKDQCDTSASNVSSQVQGTQHGVSHPASHSTSHQLSQGEKEFSQEEDTEVRGLLSSVLAETWSATFHLLVIEKSENSFTFNSGFFYILLIYKAYISSKFETYELKLKNLIKNHLIWSKNYV